MEILQNVSVVKMMLFFLESYGDGLLDYYKGITRYGVLEKTKMGGLSGSNSMK